MMKKILIVVLVTLSCFVATAQNDLKKKIVDSDSEADDLSDLPVVKKNKNLKKKKKYFEI